MEEDLFSSFIFCKLNNLVSDEETCWKKKTKVLKVVDIIMRKGKKKKKGKNLKLVGIILKRKNGRKGREGKKKL